MQNDEPPFYRQVSRRAHHTEGQRSQRFASFDHTVTQQRHSGIDS
jgi:hypothetical protein